VTSARPVQDVAIVALQFAWLEATQLISTEVGLLKSLQIVVCNRRKKSVSTDVLELFALCMQFCSLHLAHPVGL
jgi:hypothetical protein